MMPELEELYREVILDHSRRPRNFGELPDATVRVRGDNPACGDEIDVAVKFGDDGGSQREELRRSLFRAARLRKPDRWESRRCAANTRRSPVPRRGTEISA